MFQIGNQANCIGLKICLNVKYMPSIFKKERYHQLAGHAPKMEFMTSGNHWKILFEKVKILIAQALEKTYYVVKIEVYSYYRRKGWIGLYLLGSVHINIHVCCHGQFLRNSFFSYPFG